jgi:hypothetical protein
MGCLMFDDLLFWVAFIHFLLRVMPRKIWRLSDQNNV